MPETNYLDESAYRQRLTHALAKLTERYIKDLENPDLPIDQVHEIADKLADLRKHEVAAQRAQASAQRRPRGYDPRAPWGRKCDDTPLTHDEFKVLLDRSVRDIYGIGLPPDLLPPDSARISLEKLRPDFEPVGDPATDAYADANLHPDPRPDAPTRPRAPIPHSAFRNPHSVQSAFRRPLPPWSRRSPLLTPKSAITSTASPAKTTPTSRTRSAGPPAAAAPARCSARWTAAVRPRSPPQS